MRLIEVLGKIQAFGQPVLRTLDVAMILHISRAHASQLLSRLARAGEIVALRRGLWLIEKDLDPLRIAAYLISPFPSYISLQTALYFHGMISQIPDTIYAMTVGRPKVITTPVANYSFHHIHPKLFMGFEAVKPTMLLLATPEKALVDFLYLLPSKTGQFKALPELELPEQFDMERVKHYIDLIPSKRTQTVVNQKLSEILL